MNTCNESDINNKIYPSDILNLREYDDIFSALRALKININNPNDIKCFMCECDLSKMRTHIVLNKPFLKYCDECCYDVKKKFV